MAKLPSVVELNKNIQQLKELHQETGELTTEKFQQISEQSKFTSQDSTEFNDLLNEIKQDALRRIAGFYQGKLQEKIVVYQEELTNYNGANTLLSQFIDDLQDQLSQGITQMKKKQEDKDHKIIELIIESEKLNCSKTAFFSLKRYYKTKQQNRHKTNEANQYYINKLKRMSLCSWYGLSYKEGFQNNLIKLAQQDIRAIQSHFGDMVRILRQKIGEADELIQIKKNAKAEFSYSLSRNLLKTISNLSMEVMTLNQVVIKDNQTNNDDVSKFLKDINNRLNEKMNDVQKIRDKLAPPIKDAVDKKRPVIKFDI